LEPENNKIAVMEKEKKAKTVKYAVVKIKGHQYQISEKDEILVDFLDKDKPEFEVLLLVDGDKVSVGKPTLKDVKIEVKVLKEEEKGTKIRVIKYKSKSRYRKVRGFRPKFTRLLVEKIS
jgi:large subunit ribosomal protein L21